MEMIFVNGIRELFPRCFSLGCLVLMTKSLLLLLSTHITYILFLCNHCVHAYSHTTVRLLYFFKGDRDERVSVFPFFDV